MSFQDYLPSKVFQKRLVSILIIIAIGFAIFLLVKLVGRGLDALKIRRQIKELPVELRSQVDSLTLGDLQRKDSNGNGILDWEERLYGLDPLADGLANKQAVEEKREILKLSAVDNEADASVGETNDFTREFLSIIATLQTTGALTDDALQNIANSIGSKLIDPDQKELYSRSAFIIVRDSSIANSEYRRLSYNALEKLSLLPLMGREMEFVSESLHSGDPSLLAPLDDISSAYKSFADALLKVPVPESLLESHKALVNSATYVSNSLTMIQKVNIDPMTAVQGTALYNTNFLIMNNALDELAANLNL